MPVLNTFSNISKRGFGNLLNLTPYGVWVPMEPTANPQFFKGCDVAVSDDGGRFVVGTQSGDLRLSTDFGATGSLLTTGGGYGWRSVGMNYNGQYLITGSQDVGQLHVSSNFGANWTAVGSGSLRFPCVAVSRTGEFQTAFGADASNNWTLYRSANFGASFATGQTFLANSGLQPVSYVYGSQVAISESGQYQIAAGNPKPIFSSNYGVTWVNVSNLPASGNFLGVAISDSGQYQTVALLNGLIYVSSNFGATWTAKTYSDGHNRVSMSGDGSMQTVTTYSGTINIKMSYDFGETWELVVPADSGVIGGTFYNVGMSRSGRYQYAVSVLGAKSQKNVS